jgi:hypothetical protein
MNVSHPHPSDAFTSRLLHPRVHSAGVDARITTPNELRKPPKRPDTAHARRARLLLFLHVTCHGVAPPSSGPPLKHRGLFQSVARREEQSDRQVVRARLVGRKRHGDAVDPGVGSAEPRSAEGLSPALRRQGMHRHLRRRFAVGEVAPGSYCKVNGPAINVSP